MTLSSTVPQLSAPPVTNRRHDLDPAAVAAQLAARSTYLMELRTADLVTAVQLQQRYQADTQAGRTKQWLRAPTTPRDLEAMYDTMLERERTYYAKVRVIERRESEGAASQFILVYGDVDDMSVTSGTGPFDTLDKAAEWFLRGGR